MNKSLNIKVIIGSTREGRFGDKAGQWIFELAKERPDMNVELLDLRDFPLPFFNKRQTPSSIKEPYSDPEIQKWTAKIAEGDAFIIATPEYNHGYPAVLKNAIDYVHKEWHKKPIGFVSWGSAMGVRSVEQLRLVFIELQAALMRTAVHILSPWTFLDEKGMPKPGAMDQYKNSAETMLDQLAWWGNALKAARAETK